jgi:hypothetical protein
MTISIIGGRVISSSSGHEPLLIIELSAAVQKHEPLLIIECTINNSLSTMVHIVLTISDIGAGLSVAVQDMNRYRQLSYQQRFKNMNRCR